MNITETAVLIIDVQNGLVHGEPALFQPEQTLETIELLIEKARQARLPVIYMQDVDVGEAGSTEFEIHARVAPLAGDVVLSKPEADSFYQTALDAQLKELGIRNLVVAGLKTEMCVDQTCRRAHELGYHVTLARDAHSTSDTSYAPAEAIIRHHNRILGSVGTEEHYIDLSYVKDLVFEHIE